MTITQPPGQKTNDADDLLLRFLAEREEPCPICNYSLRALAQPRCPECGCHLSLRVGSPQLRVGPWALAIVSFALALGFDGVVSLILLAALITSPAPIWQPYGIVTLFVLLAAGMLSAILLLGRARPRWNRMPLRRQWTAALLIFAAVGVLHALVGAGFIAILSGVGNSPSPATASTSTSARSQDAP